MDKWAEPVRAAQTGSVSQGLSGVSESGSVGCLVLLLVMVKNQTDFCTGLQQRCTTRSVEAGASLHPSGDEGVGAEEWRLRGT